MKGKRMKLPTKKTIENSPLVKFLKNFVDNKGFINFCAKTIVSAVVLAFALIPFWGYLLIRWLIEPGDFWQEFAVFTVAAVILGLPQLIMICFGGIIIMIVILEDL